MSAAIDEARSLVEKRLTQIREEMDQLEQAHGHLGGSNRTNPRRTRSTGRTSRPSPKRARKGERAEQLVEFISKNPDVRGSEIARELRIQPSQVYQLGSRLENEGRIKKTKNRYRVKA